MTAQSIETVAVVGAGIMGAQIAQVLATSGFTVRLHDIKDEVLSESARSIENGPFGLRAAVSRGKLTEEGVGEALGRISTSTDLQETCREVDLIIEAVPELIGLKMEVFKTLDAYAPSHAILASNTGGLSITGLAHATARPDRVLGWHWSAPCSVMRMAEIVIHPGTDPEATRAVSDAARRCGKSPQVVNDQPLVWGFVANRIMLQVRREALRIVNEGVATPEQVDALMKDCFRWPVGPFEGMGGLADSASGRPEAELLR